MTGLQQRSDTPVSNPFPGSDMVFSHHGDGGMTSRNCGVRM